MNPIDSLRQIVKTFDEVYSKVCKISSVEGILCTCSPIDGTSDLLDVRLQTQQANGLLLIPSIGSMVLVSFISSDEAYVSMFSQVDSIELNGNSNGGLVKSPELESQIGKLKETVDAIVQAFSSWAPVANDGGAALKTLVSTNLTGKTTGDFSKLQNDKIKHGG